MDKVRVIRILVYEGSREWVEHTLEKGAVPANGRKVISHGMTVASMTIRGFPDVIEMLTTDKDSAQPETPNEQHQNSR